VDLLTFDGQALGWSRSLSATWESGPQALATYGDGVLAVADGDRVKLFGLMRGGEALHTWVMPNDGSPGEFRNPVDLAFGSDGSLAVAEAGNRRVSFIKDALRFDRVFLSRLEKRSILQGLR